jgi:hypothetical protein
MSSPHALSGRRGQVAAAALVAATLLNAAMFGGTNATASSHREAPLIAGDPAVETRTSTRSSVLTTRTP